MVGLLFLVWVLFGFVFVLGLGFFWIEAEAIASWFSTPMDYLFPIYIYRIGSDPVYFGPFRIRRNCANKESVCICMYVCVHSDMHTVTHIACMILFINSSNTSQFFAQFGRSFALHPLDFDFQR